MTRFDELKVECENYLQQVESNLHDYIHKALLNDKITITEYEILHKIFIKNEPKKTKRVGE